MPKLNEKIHISSNQDQINNRLLEKFSKIELDVQNELFIEETERYYEIYDFCDKNFKCLHEDNNIICEHLDGSVVLFSKLTNEIFFYIRVISHTDAIIVLITIYIYLWLSYQNILWLHASSFCYNGQNVLILGNSGSGKSTLTLAAYSNGANIISEENTCVDFNNSTTYIAINKHDIAICDKEIHEFPYSIREGAYKHLYSKEYKTMIDSTKLSYVNSKCIPSIVILLNDQKDTLACANKLRKFYAVNKIIQLHPCFNNYQSYYWINMVISMVSKLNVYEITPSLDKENTFSKVKEVIIKGEKND